MTNRDKVMIQLALSILTDIQELKDENGSIHINADFYEHNSILNRLESTIEDLRNHKIEDPCFDYKNNQIVVGDKVKFQNNAYTVQELDGLMVIIVDNRPMQVAHIFQHSIEKIVEEENYDADGNEFELSVICGGYLQAFFLLTADAIRSARHYQLYTITNEKNETVRVDNIIQCTTLFTRWLPETSN